MWRGMLTRQVYVQPDWTEKVHLLGGSKTQVYESTTLTRPMLRSRRTTPGAMFLKFETRGPIRRSITNTLTFHSNNPK
jgi:hypothetical protein